MLGKGRIRKRWAAAAAAFILAAGFICGLTAMNASAGTSVDLQASCSLKVQMPVEVSALLDPESPVTVKLYQVASIDEDSAFGYEALQGFEGLDLGSLTKEGAVAKDWDAQAKEAYDLVNDEEADRTFQLTKAGSVFEGTESGLSVGLYLMVVDELYSAAGTKRFDFIPMLISLPLIVEGGTFDYDLIVELKYGEEDLLGDLIITKHLMKSDSDHLPVTFVFHVTCDEADYDRYLDITFDASGTQSLLIEGFPAGASVKVEEVYDGAGYRLDGSVKSQTVTIIADELVTAEKPVASAEFSNTRDDEEKGGYGVTNHYTLGENGWVVEKVSDNTSTDNVVYLVPEVVPGTAEGSGEE